MSVNWRGSKLFETMPSSSCSCMFLPFLLHPTSTSKGHEILEMNHVLNLKARGREKEKTAWTYSTHRCHCLTLRQLCSFKNTEKALVLGWAEIQNRTDKKKTLISFLNGVHTLQNLVQGIRPSWDPPLVGPEQNISTSVTICILLTGNDLAANPECWPKTLRWWVKKENERKAAVFYRLAQGALVNSHLKFTAWECI